ncbi:MAG: c-type cytochrome domain-containing protein [Verrucomicrobiales bacterium]
MTINTRNCLVFSAILALVSCPLGARAADPGVFGDIILPIFEAKCVSCHGEDKHKGKLRLDSYEAVIEGGDEAEGENVIAGNAKDSFMSFRLLLPLDDDEHMPPEDEDQLTKNEVRLIEWWIDQGGKKDLTIAAAKKPKDLEPIIAHALANKPVAAKKKKAPIAKRQYTEKQLAAAAKVMVKVNATGASLMEISAESGDLRFTALNVADKYGDGQLADLAPIADMILWLDLSGTKVTDKGLAQLKTMKNLERLYLQNTAVTDKGLDHLGGLAELRYLNLYGNAVGDSGARKLGALKHLEKVFLWQTKVTEKGAASLGKQVAGLDVNIGWSEPPIVAKAPAPKPEAKAAAKPAAKPAPKPAVKEAPVQVVLAKAVADAKVAAARAKKTAEEAGKAADEARRAVSELQKVIDRASAPKAQQPVKAAAKPKAAPKATPKPKAKATPKAKAAPKATPKAKATPPAKAKPVAEPKAKTPAKK